MSDVEYYLIYIYVLFDILIRMIVDLKNEHFYN